MLRSIWSYLRGVHSPENYRRLCVRCGKCGQTHFSLRSVLYCIRFQGVTPCISRTS